MEIFFVYSLVFLFLLGLALLSVLILATHPDKEERASAPVYSSSPISVQEGLIAYGILAGLLLFFLLVTVWSRAHCEHLRLDMHK